MKFSKMIETSLVRNYLDLLEFSKKDGFIPSKMFYQRVRDLSSLSVMVIIIYKWCNFKSVLSRLLLELKIKNIKGPKGAHYLAWIILQYITTISKEKPANFTLVIEILKWLYENEDENVCTTSQTDTQNHALSDKFDYSSSECVYKFSPLIIFAMVYKQHKKINLINNPYYSADLDDENTLRQSSVNSEIKQETGTGNRSQSNSFNEKDSQETFIYKILGNTANLPTYLKPYANEILSLYPKLEEYYNDINQKENKFKIASIANIYKKSLDEYGDKTSWPPMVIASKLIDPEDKYKPIMKLGPNKVSYVKSQYEKPLDEDFLDSLDINVRMWMINTFNSKMEDWYNSESLKAQQASQPNIKTEATENNDMSDIVKTEESNTCNPSKQTSQASASSSLNLEISNTNPSFAFLDTYAKICRYPELIALGPSKVIHHLRQMIEIKFWPGVNAILELITYQLQHIHTNLALKVLLTSIKLHSKSSESNEMPWTLYNTLENTILYIIVNFSLASWDMYNEITKYIEMIHEKILYHTADINEFLIKSNTMPNIRFKQGSNHSGPNTSKQLESTNPDIDISTMTDKHKVIISLGFVSKSERINRLLVMAIASMCKLNGVGTDSSFSNYMIEIVEAIDYITPLEFVGKTLNCLPIKMKNYFMKSHEIRLKKQLGTLLGTQMQNIPTGHLNLQQLKDKYQEARAANLKENVEKHVARLTTILAQQAQAQNLNPSEPTSNANNAKCSGLSVSDWTACQEFLLCVVWDMFCKQILRAIEGTNLPKAFQSMPAKNLADLVEPFSCYIIYTLSDTVGPDSVTSKILFIQELMWKHRIVDFDRLILSLILFPLENTSNNQYSDVSCSIIQLLILKDNQEFYNRCLFALNKNSNVEYHSVFNDNSKWERTGQRQLPCYYNNICLRFLPIFDVLFGKLISELGFWGGRKYSFFLMYIIIFDNDA